MDLNICLGHFICSVQELSCDLVNSWLHTKLGELNHLPFPALEPGGGGNYHI